MVKKKNIRNTIKKNKDTKVSKKEQAEAIFLEGSFISNKKGFGFVSVEGVDEDFFIPEKYTLNAFHGDIVRISVLPKSRGRRSEAKVVKILEHGLTRVIGTFERSGSFGFVRPDNAKISKDIYVSRPDDMDADDNTKVEVEIIDYGNENRGPAGRVVEIIGNNSDPYIDIISIAKAYGIPEHFPEEVIAEAETVPLKVESKDRRGRLNLRDELIITIDGDDSKDLDDAISLKKEGDVYVLGVHIADVSHYVKEGSPLDKEAFNRSTSVYLTDVVIPMLPERLCNGICSLLEGEQRLTLSCIMRIDTRGRILESMITPSFIVNKRRMTYNQVNAIFADTDGREAMDNRELMPMLFMMKELADILRRARTARGAIDFDIPEAKIKLDENGYPVDISARERGISERMIEDFMLAANETVAKTYFDKEIPLLYRSHEAPSLEKVMQLADLCALFGVRFRMSKKGQASPKDIQKLLMDAKESEYESLLSTVALRSMQQAKYSSTDSFHFGLAAPYYCHFTSPIRRYPDLLVHRIIKECKKRPLSKKKRSYYEGFLPVAAEQTSRLERRAIECEREVDKLKKAEYMLKRVEHEYDGVVTGVTSWGMFVALPNTVEGMVPIQNIGHDHFICNEKTYEIIGEHTGIRYTLGDKVRVCVDKADVVLRMIDFRIIDDGKNRKKPEKQDERIRSKVSAKSGKKKHSKKQKGKSRLFSS